MPVVFINKLDRSMTSEILKIATCQFPVSGSVAHNSEHICRQIAEAKELGGDIVHFPECALSGYAGVDFESFDGYDWDLLRVETQKIMDIASKNAIWVVLGSSHQLTEPNKPHNCLYLIGPDGKIANRYDKRFCTKTDLSNYTPGKRFVDFTINGVKCGLLICFDLRFPEIYRAVKRRGVQFVMQSFYNARQQGPSIHSEIMRQTMQCRAATNYFWTSMTNSCGWFCPYPSCFIRPDGKIVKQLEDHKEGVMVNTVDLSADLYDPSAEFRQMAMDGALDNGTEINDPRSRDTSSL